jgi:Ti-type conjugative transfer relaxase TraA
MAVMAIYHFSAKVISRAAGSSALAAAAYRSASRLHDQRLDRHHDFSNKAGVVHSEVMLPDGAAPELSDRESLWNAVELAEKRIDAQLAREIEFAIPRELSMEDGITLARDFVRDEFVSRGMIADLNVHWDIGTDGEAKPHAHVMLTMRAVNEEGFGPKVRDWNATSLLEHWRESWAAHANERLAALDIDARIDPRSFETQGIDLEPQPKIGPAAARMSEQGLSSERVDHQLEIARENGAKIIADPAIGLDAITRTQATFTKRDLAMFVHRHSEGKDQFDLVTSVMRASPDIVALGKDGRGEDRFTSRAMIETEQRLERATTAMVERDRHGVDERFRERAIILPERRGMILSGEQRAAFEHVTNAKDLGVVIGYAGTGKSAMLGVAREAWEGAGYHVRGLALSGIAAENLESGSGIASRTIASLEHQWSRDRELPTAKDVFVIDEAGLIGSRQMERVVSAVEAAGAKLVLVGDAQQLQAIEAGAAFRSIAERHGAIEITEVRRQQVDWQRDATRQLATGRTGEALAHYRDAGMVTMSDTREGARDALISGWNDACRSDPSQSRIILSHTRAECDELSDLARAALKRDGMLTHEIAVKTSGGSRLFAPQDRIMFLRNERELGVKNGSLGTIDSISSARIAVLLDDGRSVAFDTKDYADISYGYATTIHKAQGVTVDRTHVLATPGLDAHATYVGLSRHRKRVDLHYSRDDFANEAKLIRTLSRERPKDMALDYQTSQTRFANLRSIDRSAILDTLAQEKLVDRSHVAPEPAIPKRGMFDGLKLGTGPTRTAAPRDIFAGLKLEVSSKPTQPALSGHDNRLGGVVTRYARSIEDMQRMIARDLPVLEQQKAVQRDASRALERVRPGATADLHAALMRDNGLVGEASKGQTANAVHQMQLEMEVRNDPDLRADRFVQTWQHDKARGKVEDAMKAAIRGLEKDPKLGAALVKRANLLGLGRQWSPEWSQASPDGGMAHQLNDQARTRAVMQGLSETLGRGRNLGLGL